MPKIVLTFLLMLSFAWKSNAQNAGCTDPAAENFNKNAQINEGSCKYKRTSYSPLNEKKLPKDLKEVSGMVYWDGKLVMLNDGGNENELFVVDTATAKVKQVIVLQGTTNIDWEDITQDSLNFYVADIGNNSSGNRKDLVIYKVPKAAIPTGDTVVIAPDQIERIQFSYADQTDFAAQKDNHTRFDCEAIVYLHGQLHLFTKNWIGDYTVHYQLPALPGNYVAGRLDSMQTDNFIITGADSWGDDELILTSYTLGGRCALWLVFGFGQSDMFFESGNKRTISLPPVLETSQLESVCFSAEGEGWLASERIHRKVVKVDQKMMQFSLVGLTKEYYLNHPVTGALSAGK